MRTILVNFTGKNGGGPQYAYEMTKSLKNSGNKIIALLSNKIDNMDEWVKLDLEEIITIKTYNGYVSFIIAIFKFIFWYRIKIKKAIGKYKIDYVYIPMEQPFSTVINRIVNKPYILTVHDVIPHSGDNLITKSINDVLNHNLKKKAYLVILLSKVFVNQYADLYSYQKDNIIVCKHGFLSSYLTMKPFPINLEYSKECNFIFFGRISKYKGIDILLKAYNMLERENNNVSLTIAGSGDLDKYKHLLLQSRNVNIFNRWIHDSEIISFFSIPNMVLVVPYIDASQSGVITLAQMFKVLVIASSTGGIIEQVEDGSTGVLVEPGNFTDFYNAMKSVTEGQLETTMMIENAYDTGVDIWDNEILKLISLLEILEKKTFLKETRK
jgi:glycosyltransferase involved in cell wall biosynthesis